MSQVDEGLLHAWLDGALPPDEAGRIEALVRTDPAWAEAAAEARGLIANASRLVAALDDGVVGSGGAVPAPTLGVVRGATAQPAARRVAPPEAERVLRLGRRIGAIAAVLLVGVVGRMAWRGTGVEAVQAPGRGAESAARASTPAAVPPADVASGPGGDAGVVARSAPAKRAGTPTAEVVAGVASAPASAPASAAASAPAPVAADAASANATTDAVATAERKAIAATPAAVAVAAPTRVADAAAQAMAREAGAPVPSPDSLERRQARFAERLGRTSVALEQVVVTGAASDGALSNTARPVTWLEERACVRALVRWESDATLPASRAEVLQEVRGLRLDGDTARFEVAMPAQRIDGTSVDTRARLALGRRTGQGVAELVRPDGTVARRGRVSETAQCP